MDSSIINTIVNELEFVVDDIQHQLSVKGFDYTGFASDSLRIDVREDRVLLWGADYIEFLEHGRGKTNKPGNGTATKKIYEWVERKLAPLLGISPDDEKRIEELKFFVARKIHKYGTAVRRGTREPLGLEKIVDDFERNISKKIVEDAKLQIKLKLDKFKKIYKFEI